MAVLKIKDAEGNWQKIPVLGGSDVDVSTLVPKTGDRGVLAGFNTLNFVLNPTETVVINGTANDDTFIQVGDGAEVNVSFEKGGAKCWVKQVAILNPGGTVTLSVPEDGSVIFDNASEAYTPSVFDLLVYVWYGSAGVGAIYTKQVM